MWRPADLAAPTEPRDVVYTEPGELPQLLHAGVAFPLRRTDVRAELRGDAAEVVVKQRFVNDGEAALEAIYTFPLPENPAVTHMRMTIGDRVIASEIRERGAARQVYQEARDAGNTAALLEQERPNIFTQSVANIPRGAAIEVEIRYAQTLSYDAGEYEFVFPTVVGPRYIPGDGRVQDAARISPPVLGLVRTCDKYRPLYYAAASGDFNPINIDPDSAKRRAWAATSCRVCARWAGRSRASSTTWATRASSRR